MRNDHRSCASGLMILNLKGMLLDSSSTHALLRVKSDGWICFILDNILNSHEIYLVVQEVIRLWVLTPNTEIEYKG